MARSAIITGYTGLVGRELLGDLLESADYSEVKALGRRAPTVAHEKLRWIKSDFTDLEKRSGELAADDAFCCLGTTRRAAGSKAAFERVDFHMVMDFARLSRKAGAKRFFLVSALSASARSPIYYNRIKGRTEDAVQGIGFDALHVIRPSLLIGEREERRPGERVAQRLFPLLNPLLVGPFRPMRAVRASTVASAMLDLASQGQNGTHIHTLPL